MAEDTSKSTISSWGASALLHGLLLLLLALIVLKGPAQREQEVPQVLLDMTNSETLGEGGSEMQSNTQGGAPSHERIRQQTRSEATSAPPTVTPPNEMTGPSVEMPNPDIAKEFQYNDPAFNVLAELAAEPAAQSAVGQGADPMLQGTSAGFQKMVGGMRGKGLDVVFIFDATSSMKPYVDQAKDRIHDVIQILTGLLSSNGRPPANLRFGVVAFKDYGDDYGIDTVRVLPLTEDSEKVQSFINQIRVGGGGDDPEPTQHALNTATDSGDMGWRGSKKNVIILISDAPIHNDGRRDSVELARRFARRLSGTINVIDVDTSHTEPLTDLANIAEAGNGSAFTLADEQAFWKYLIVSILGKRFEADVQTILDRYAQSP